MGSPPRRRLLAVSGSLRSASVNSALLRALAQRAPPALDVEVFQAVGALPLFNPDLETQLPAAVQGLYASVGRADVLVIASPEYAHGVTGVIKNLLDWLVSYPPFVDLPVAVLNTSPRAHHADAALRETLRTMNARVLAQASVTLPVLGYCRTTQEILAEPALVHALDALLAELSKVGACNPH